MISVDGLHKAFGARVAVEGLTFSVARGEVFGLLGPNGAGKTTTVRMLAGLLRPSGGHAEVAGFRLPLEGEGSEFRKHIGLLTEQPGLYDRLSARDNLRFFIKLHELDERAVWSRLEMWLERFGLSGRADEPVGGFSKGMRQKLAIVRTLVHEPKVLFLDEPTSGLDPESARVVRDSIAELASAGATVILCSHNLPEVERLCSRVAVVKNRLRTVASLTELKKEGVALDVQVEGEASRFISVVTALPHEARVHAEGSKLRVTMPNDAHTPEVIAALVAAGARIHTATRAARPLEEASIELVREEAEAA